MTSTITIVTSEDIERARKVLHAAEARFERVGPLWDALHAVTLQQLRQIEGTIAKPLALPASDQPTQVITGLRSLFRRQPAAIEAPKKEAAVRPRHYPEGKYL